MRSIAIAALWFAAVSIASAYEKRVAHVVEQLRDLQSVGSDAVGFAGTPHDFYTLYRYCWSASTDGDLIEMLQDRSPVVRLMGVKCIVTSSYRHIDQALLRPLRADGTTLLVGPGGCVFTEMTVGDVVGNMIRDPDYLGPAEPQRPTRQPKGPKPPFSQVPRFDFLEKSRVVMLGDLKSDANGVFLTAREVWKGPITVGESIRMPKSANGLIVGQRPWVAVVAFADYPNLKTWTVQGTDCVRIGDLDHPTIQELREYFADQSQSAGDSR